MKKMIFALVAMLTMAISANAQKFGHVDTQSIMQNLPELTKVNGELQAIAQQYDNDIKAMQDELQRKMEEYDKNKATMSATAQQEQENALQEMYQKIQQTAQQNQQEFQKQQQEKMAPIQQKIMTAIQNVGKTGQYTYIFEQGAALYVGTGSKDVTAEVKAELNKLK
ncbi:MAG: OmpH family outer membrane protein [Prevotella sp.]|nr:OmpH family outer membrane protein [Candidatus Prevotella equi]